jgi:DNA transformation protein
MPKADRFVEFTIEQLAPLGAITARAMMGGWCLYCDGVVFALIASGVLYLKGDAVNIPQFKARGLRPFQPFPDKESMMKYFQAPPEIFEDPEAMRTWVGGAVEAGRRAKGKKKTPKRA